MSIIPDVPILCIFCNQELPSYEFHRSRKHWNRCKECDRIARNQHTLERKLWANAKQRAYTKNLPFSITPEDIIVPNVCPVLGIKLERGGVWKRDEAPSMDRLVPSKGYVKENIAVISFRANRIKNNGTAAEHTRIAEWMRENGSEPADSEPDCITD